MPAKPPLRGGPGTRKRSIATSCHVPVKPPFQAFQMASGEVDPRDGRWRADLAAPLRDRVDPGDLHLAPPPGDGAAAVDLRIAPIVSLRQPTFNGGGAPNPRGSVGISPRQRPVSAAGPKNGALGGVRRCLPPSPIGGERRSRARDSPSSRKSRTAGPNPGSSAPPLARSPPGAAPRRYRFQGPVRNFAPPEDSLHNQLRKTIDSWFHQHVVRL